jgi:hypothetical protein
MPLYHVITQWMAGAETERQFHRARESQWKASEAQAMPKENTSQKELSLKFAAKEKG